MKKIRAALAIALFPFGLPADSLPIPPLLEGDNLEMEIREGKLTLPFGTSRTLGFNGDYLGPTIRVSEGDDVAFTINNTLSEDTTVHWHGLHVPAEYDGGPRQVIKAGEVWKPRITIDQPAATLWYHPHLMGKTAEHVYRGLAGMFIIDDDYSRSLSLPRDYGVNDIPLILQDRDVDRSGRFAYRPSMPDIMHGYLGNRLLINGAHEPELRLEKGTYRFRILNGSNSSVFRLSFSDQSEFTVIASDGGFLPRSFRTSQLVISPGERYEILHDFTEEGTEGLTVETWGGAVFDRALSFSVGSGTGRFYGHPESFAYTPVSPGSDHIRRNFTMETGMMGRFTINGKSMDMGRIDFRLEKDSDEVWTVVNVPSGMMTVPHSFHVHDVQFSVLSLNGDPPPPLLGGPKDTILLWPGDRYEIALSFRDYTGIYMYHCHMLEHEDAGMMGQFEIEEK